MEYFGFVAILQHSKTLESEGKNTELHSDRELKLLCNVENALLENERVLESVGEKRNWNETRTYYEPRGLCAVAKL